MVRTQLSERNNYVKHCRTKRLTEFFYELITTYFSKVQHY